MHMFALYFVFQKYIFRLQRDRNNFQFIASGFTLVLAIMDSLGYFSRFVDSAFSRGKQDRISTLVPLEQGKLGHILYLY